MKQSQRAHCLAEMFNPHYINTVEKTSGKSQANNVSDTKQAIDLIGFNCSIIFRSF